MKSILITGCNRGLGLGLVKTLVRQKNPPECLITTCRDIPKAKELQAIADEFKSVHILQLDVTDFKSHADFSSKVSEIVKEDGLNVLFNSAGYSPKYTRIQYVKVEQMMDAFTINTVAPIMLTKAILPLLVKAAEKNSSLPMGTNKAAIVNMSSVLASIDMNKDGGLYPYKCSKVALNMASVSMSIDLKKEGILVTALHPGWVKTDMGGSKAPMDVDTSTASLVNLLYELNEKHNGGFFQWNGTKLKW